MVQVTELGYMGFGVKDLEALKKFAADVLAMEVVDEGPGDRCYLLMDYWHHRIVLHSDPSDDLMYLGFRVAGGEDLRDRSPGVVGDQVDAVQVERAFARQRSSIQ